MEEENVQISAKLNPEFDRELIRSIKKIPKRERSHTYRVALKQYFGNLERKEGDL